MTNYDRSWRNLNPKVSSSTFKLGSKSRSVLIIAAIVLVAYWIITISMIDTEILQYELDGARYKHETNQVQLLRAIEEVKQDLK